MRCKKSTLRALVFLSSADTILIIISTTRWQLWLCFYRCGFDSTEQTEIERTRHPSWNVFFYCRCVGDREKLLETLVSAVDHPWHHHSPNFVHNFSAGTVNDACLEEIIGNVQTFFAALSELADDCLVSESLRALLDAGFDHGFHGFGEVNFHALRKLIGHPSQPHFDRMRVAADCVLKFW